MSTLNPLPPPTRNWLKRLEQALAAGLAVMLWGVPGVGKTARILALAARWRCHVEVLVASTRDVTDFSGLPQFADDGTTVRLVAFDFVRRLNEAAARDGRVLRGAAEPLLPCRAGHQVRARCSGAWQRRAYAHAGRTHEDDDPAGHGRRGRAGRLRRFPTRIEEGACGRPWLLHERAICLGGGGALP